MNLIPVESSNVDAIGYTPTSRLLYVRFKNDRTYAYFNVPDEVWTEFAQADSKGKFFNLKIKDKFGWTKVSK